MNVIKKMFVVIVALIGFVIGANAQYLNATVDGQSIAGKATKQGSYSYYVTSQGGGTGIVYNEQKGTATIVHKKGRKWYIGETTAVLNCSNVGIYTLQITRSCNLFYAGANYDDAAISRMLCIDITGTGDYFSCSSFKVEW